MADAARVNDSQALRCAPLVRNLHERRSALARKSGERRAEIADAPVRGRVEEGGRLHTGFIIQHALDAELQPTAALHHCPPVNERDGRRDRLLKDDLAALKLFNALRGARPIACRSVGCLKARARVSVKLDAKARADRTRSTRTNEARVIKSEDDHDAVAHDPLVNCAQAELAQALAVPAL